MMKEQIQEVCEKYNCNMVNIDTNKELSHIYQLLIHNKLFQPETSTELLYFGFYCNYIEKDYKRMKEYYEMAVEKGNSSAMYNLGYYYHYIEKDYDNMKKYFLMAVEKGDSGAMTNLGYYYRHIEKDYELMKKYYEMAIEKGDSAAMNNLGYYYNHIEKDYKRMKEYYEMAIEKGDSDAMCNLGYYYHHIEKDYDNMKKYYEMAIKLGDGSSKQCLLEYYTNSDEQYEDGLKFFITYYPEKLHEYLPRIFQKEENITPKIKSLLITIEDLTLVYLADVNAKTRVGLLRLATRHVDSQTTMPTSNISAVSECAVCFDAPPNTAFVPCGHMVTCHTCAEAIENCVVCRAQIAQSLRIYQ